jgi:hypothetical protein
VADARLAWTDTGGGPFILLPLARKKDWGGGEAPGLPGGDLEVRAVGEGQALLLGRSGPATFLPDVDGGVIVQRLFPKEDAFVREAIGRVLAPGPARWTETPLRFDVGAGRLALFDAAFTFKAAAREATLDVRLPRGVYALATMRYETELFEASLVRFRRMPEHPVTQRD